MKKIISAVLVLSMMLSLTACMGKKVKEYDADGVVKVLTDNLGIPAGEVHRSEVEAKGDNPPATSITSKYHGARITCMITSANYAKSVFDKNYGNFMNEFNSDNKFDGNCINGSDDNSGYIVIQGDHHGVSLFGDRYRTSKLYAAYYRAGSMVIMIVPEDGGMIQDVGEVIDEFGFPNV